MNVFKEVLFVSHKWDAVGVPDASGTQLAKLQEFLQNNLQIKFIWYDFSCLFQPDAIGAWAMGQAYDLDMFYKMLGSLTFVYLVTDVLILHDERYDSSAWCLVEAWGASQQVVRAGLSIAGPWQQRWHILHVKEARQPPEPLRQFHDKHSWNGLFPEDMCKVLERDDIKVTGNTDKSKIVAMVRKLNERVQMLVSAKCKNCSAPAWIGEDGYCSVFCQREHEGRIARPRA